MHGCQRLAAAALVPLLLVAAAPGRAEEPPPAPIDDDSEGDEAYSPAARLGLAALGGALGAVGGFSLGATLAGVAYPLVRREPPVVEGLAVGIGTPVAMTLAGAGAGAALLPMVLGDPPSLGAGLGATGGAAVVGTAAAVPGAWLTWEAAKAMGAAIGQPSPEGCILSLVGLSAALSVMFGGFCVGATSGAGAGGAAGALVDAPDELGAPANPSAPAGATALAY